MSTATPLSFKARMLAEKKAVKAAMKAESVAQTRKLAQMKAAAEAELCQARYAPVCSRIERWIGQCTDPKRKLALIDLAILADKLANGSNGTTRSVAAHTAKRGTAKVILADGTELVAPNTNAAVNQARVIMGQLPIAGAFSAPREAHRLGIQLLHA